MNWRKAPWGTLGSVAMMVLMGASRGGIPVNALLVGSAFLWILFGLPVDAWIRTGRVATAVTWMLFPWFTGWLTGYALEHLADPESLWYVPAATWVPGPLREFAGFPGFLAGLVTCIFIEKLENRTGKTPTVLPLQVFGLFFGFWLVSSIAAKSLPESWKQGQFVFGAGAVCLAWLAVRVARTVLNDNAARRAIEERKGSG